MATLFVCPIPHILLPLSVLLLDLTPLLINIYILRVGTQTNLLAYDIKDTRDILHKEVCSVHFNFYHLHVCTQSHLYRYMCRYRALMAYM